MDLNPLQMLQSLGENKIAVLQKDYFGSKAGLEVHKFNNVYMSAPEQGGKAKFYDSEEVENHVDDGWWAWKGDNSTSLKAKDDEIAKLKRELEQLKKPVEAPKPEVVVREVVA
jgi:hypothetical protein